MIAISTNDKLQISLDADVTTTQPSCFAAFTDETPGKQSVNGRGISRTNGVTAIDLVSAPSANTTRVVNHISVVNTDTASVTVTVKLNSSGTNYELAKFTLGASEKLEYSSQSGFRVFANSGAIKHSINQGTNPSSSGGLSRVILGTDVVNNNASANTIASVTGLSFPVTSGKLYYFRFTIVYDAAATTTGSRWAISGPTFTYLAATSAYGLTATTQTLNYVNAYDTPAAANATSVATAGNICVIEGFITPSAAGDVIARFASEVSASAITAKIGSMVEYIQLT